VSEGSASRALPVLLETLRAHAPPAAYGWLEGALPASAEQAGRPAFFGALAGAARRFGTSHPPLSEAARSRLQDAGLVEPGAWSLTDLARAALLLAASAQLPAERHVAVATEVFRKGDTSERVSLLRSLPLLAEPQRFAPLGIEACRSHVLDVLLAIAHHNPLPARAFPEPAFNQLVMKLLFVEQRLGPVHQWRSRVGAELLRMARDFEAERRAAGRPLPTDLPLLLAMETPP
jgi:hypothetical protein